MSKEREQKNRQPHKKGAEEMPKHHAPSHHGEEAGHRGAHHGAPRHEPPKPPEHSETDYPPPGRSPAEEFSPDDEGG